LIKSILQIITSTVFVLYAFDVITGNICIIASLTLLSISALLRILPCSSFFKQSFDVLSGLSLQCSISLVLFVSGHILVGFIPLLGVGLWERLNQYTARFDVTSMIWYQVNIRIANRITYLLVFPSAALLHFIIPEYIGVSDVLLLLSLSMILFNIMILSKIKA
jgi:hypothetical protein